MENVVEVLRVILWDLRHDLGLTQGDFAKRYCIAPSTYQALETKGSSPRLDSLAELFAALQETPAQLFSRFDYGAEADDLDRRRRRRDDEAFRSLRSVLSPDIARRLARVISTLEAQETGKSLSLIQIGESMANLPTPPTPANQGEAKPQQLRRERR